MVTVRDVHPKNLLPLVKEKLKKIEEIKPPEWSKFVKTGVSRQRPPEQKDFWYIRSSSILRRIYLDGPVGVERMRTFYGGLKRRGTAPSRARKGSGTIIRNILQQLEEAGLVKTKEKMGRVITPKGQKMLDNLAYKAREKLEK